MGTMEGNSRRSSSEVSSSDTGCPRSRKCTDAVGSKFRMATKNLATVHRADVQSMLLPPLRRPVSLWMVLIIARTCARRSAPVSSCTNVRGAPFRRPRSPSQLDTPRPTLEGERVGEVEIPRCVRDARSAARARSVCDDDADDVDHFAQRGLELHGKRSTFRAAGAARLIEPTAQKAFGIFAGQTSGAVTRAARTGESEPSRTEAHSLCRVESFRRRPYSRLDRQEARDWRDGVPVQGERQHVALFELVEQRRAENQCGPARRQI